MSLWLMAADDASSVPASTLTGLFVVKRVPRQGYPNDRSGWDLCAALSPDRPGPFRVLVTLTDEDEALNALESLTMTLATDVDGVVTWDEGWQFLVDPVSPEAGFLDG
jgi:hypothetical protein